MDHFNFINGHLQVEHVDVRQIVEQHGSPVYIYSAQTLKNHYAVLQDAFSALSPLICFSVKSCSNLSILKLLVDEGSGLDVVSGGELYRALMAGVTADKIVFAGVGKSREEISYAVEAGVLLFNVESEAELLRLDEIASTASKRIKVTIRVNPDVADAGTHEKNLNGRSPDKIWHTH
ncbi:hypothetical protein K2E95_09055 [Pseudomonas sp. ERGC3:01]|nr:hypothetical protein [Pseudomonas sp. ERGC3:01]